MSYQPFSLTVTLQTITPLFLGGAYGLDGPEHNHCRIHIDRQRGANGRAEPELRPPSFRGVLRYWLRAALGGVVGDKDINTLRELESAVFGSTDHGSPVRVRLSCPHGQLKTKRVSILPHIRGKGSGERNAFAAGQEFELIMSQDGICGEEVWNAACSALMLALTFGGVGLRSRRGYGTLHVVNSSNPELVWPFPQCFDEWKEHVKRVVDSSVNSARQLCKNKNKTALNSPPNGPTEFPCANKQSLIRLCDRSVGTAQQAVTEFMKAVPKHAALGGIQPRQSSPLWVRPIRTGNSKYGLLFCVLASSFKGDDYDFIRTFLDNHFPGCDLTLKGWNS